MMKTTELKVGGMTCGGCEQSIARALRRIEGVLEVTAEHASGRVVVSSEADLDRTALEGAVKDAGYVVIPAGARDLPTT
jgi:copper chaperone CopZ